MSDDTSSVFLEKLEIHDKPDEPLTQLHLTLYRDAIVRFLEIADQISAYWQAKMMDYWDTRGPDDYIEKPALSATDEMLYNAFKHIVFLTAGGDDGQLRAFIKNSEDNTFALSCIIPDQHAERYYEALEKHAENAVNTVTAGKNRTLPSQFDAAIFDALHQPPPRGERKP